MDEVVVVICCYNHSRYIEQALDSVADQTLRPCKLIITDDASTDESPELIRSWIARRWPDADFHHNETNLGLPRTLNRIIPRLVGEYVALMSGDDWMAVDRLETQVAVFNASPAEVGMVYADMTEVDATGVPTGQKWFDLDRMGPAVSGDLFPEMIQRAFISAPTVLLRRGLLQAMGPYDETLVAEDYDMFLRLSRVAEWRYIDKPLVNYRVLPTSLSRSDDFRTSYRLGRIRLLKKHIGVSEFADSVISDRVAQMAESLYGEGRSCRETAVDMKFALRYKATAKRVLIFLVASLRIPGPPVVRLKSLLRSFSMRRNA